MGKEKKGGRAQNDKKTDDEEPKLSVMSVWSLQLAKEIQPRIKVFWLSWL